MTETRLALLATWNQVGIVELGRELQAIGYYIVSTGATAKTLKDSGIPVIPVEQLSGTAEILDGKVSLLHPAILGGVVADRGQAAHLQTLTACRVAPIDIVAVNLPPWPASLNNTGHAIAGIGFLDTGGSAALVGAAANCGAVVPLCDPADYGPTLVALKSGQLTLQLRAALAAKALVHVAERLSAGAAAVTGRAFAHGSESGLFAAGQPAPAGTAASGLHRPAVEADEDSLFVDLEAPVWMERGTDASRGLHLYRDVGAQVVLPSSGQLILGEPLTAQGLVDVDVAWSLLVDLGREAPAACLAKQATACSAAVMKTSVAGAVLRALDADPLSAVGAVLAVNRPVDASVIRALNNRPIAVLLAPAFDDAVVESLRANPAIRLVQMGDPLASSVLREVRTTQLGVLVQDRESATDLAATWSTVTATKPSAAEQSALAIAARVVRYMPGCAMVLADEQGTVGMGGGLPSRADITVVAIGKCRKGYKPIAAAIDTPLAGRELLDSLAKLGVKALFAPRQDDHGTSPAPEWLEAAQAVGLSVVVGLGMTKL